MTIVEIHATASHSYYERKSRRDIVYALKNLHAQLPEPKPYLAPDKELMKKPRHELASLAMSFHALLSDD